MVVLSHTHWQLQAKLYSSVDRYFLCGFPGNFLAVSMSSAPALALEALEDMCIYLALVPGESILYD